MTIPNCPVCGGMLRRNPQRKNKCPHCGDWICWKYSPGQTREDALLVGSVEAARIEALWQARDDLKRAEEATESRRIRAENIRDMCSCPDVVALKLCRSEMCERWNCAATRTYFSTSEVLEKSPIPCRENDDCYGGMVVVFDDELTPQIYAEARIPFPIR